MSLTTRPERGSSLALRLTLMYAAVSGTALCAVLAVSYLFLQGILQRRLDEVLLQARSLIDRP